MNASIDHNFDPVALRQKYRLERDKRLRADHNEQYQEAKGDFSHYLDDPYVAPGFEREPLRDVMDVVRFWRAAGGRAPATGRC
jgi:cyclohexanone monooxygenase